MPLWNRDLTRPRNTVASAQITVDGTYTASGGMLCSVQPNLDASRRYRIATSHAFTTDNVATGGFNPPTSDVLLLSLHYAAGAVSLSPTSAELTSDTVTDDSTWADLDDAPNRAMSLSYLLPAGWSGVYTFGVSIKVLTFAQGSTSDIFYGQSGFKFQMVLTDVGQA